MDYETTRKAQPMDSFTAVYKQLAWIGFYKLLNKPRSRFKHLCHQMYRPFAFLVAVLFNAHFLIFMWQKRDDVDILFDALVEEIPELNLVMKIIVINLGSSSLDKLNDLINDPIFAANSEKDEEFLTENTTAMRRMLKVINIGIAITSFFWMLTPVFKRLQNPNATVPAYFPFDTTSWVGFSFSVILETVPIYWIGYGHIAMDCLIAAHYAQATVQLKIVKYNLEHISDSCKSENTVVTDGRVFLYKDVQYRHLNKRFQHYVRRYERVLWYVKEVNNVFNNAIVFQFLTASSTACLIIYKLSLSDILTVPFYFLVVFFCVLQTQIFLYCYFGGLVQYESQSVASSMYLGDWLSLSPRLRRQVVIAMSRWSIPITPRVASIIPLSLNTFITIVRSAYTLYTMLKGTRK